MKSITLKSTLAEATIAPHLGGAILSYNANIDGKLVPILRNSNTATSVLDASSFPLIPYSNRIKKGTFFWQDRTYSLPLNHPPEKHSIHGHGWQTQWQVTSQTENTLVIEYSYAEPDWPSQYKAIQTFSLTDAELHCELILENIGNEEMPAGLGFHPYFSRTPQASLQCAVTKMWRTDNECLPTELVDAPAEFSQNGGMKISQDTYDNVFTGFVDDAHVYWPEWNAKATMTTSSNCKFMVLYNPENENFFCVEPVTHCTDAINLANNGYSNTGIATIKPDQKLLISMSILPSTHSFN